MSPIFVSVYLFFRHYGLLGMFLSMFIENIGIPLPTEIGYLIGVTYTQVHPNSTLFIVSLLTLGHVAGSSVAYAIGRYGHKWFHQRLHYSRRYQDIHDRLVRWYDEYGAITIFATRFIGYVRPWSSFVAGYVEFPFPMFVGLTLIGSLIFNLIALYSSWIVVTVWQRYAAYHIVIAVMITLSFSGFIMYQLFRHLQGGNQSKKSRTDAEDGQSPRSE